MNKFLPLIFVLLWSSAFVTTKPIVDNSDPFAALAFRFFIVALGFLIVVIVIYFPEGLMGWLREKYPEKFGEVVDEADRKAQVELK